MSNRDWDLDPLGKFEIHPDRINSQGFVDVPECTFCHVRRLPYGGTTLIRCGNIKITCCNDCMNDSKIERYMYQIGEFDPTEHTIEL